MLLTCIATQGLIDIDVEIEKCEKKKRVAQLALDKIKKNEAHPTYEQTVDAETRAGNDEKVSIFLPVDVRTEILMNRAEKTTRG